MNTLKEEMIKRVEELNEKLEGKEFHLEVKEAFKNNGNKYGITILSDNNKCKMCPTVYKECMEDAAAKIVKVIDTVEPEPELAAKYEEKYRKFAKIYPTVKDLFSEII